MEEPTWLPERLERAKQTALRSLLDELGYADVDTLKSTLTDQAAQLEQLTQEHLTAIEQAQHAESSRQAAWFEAAFQGACTPYTFFDVDEVRKLGDFSGVTIDEAGQVSGMREAIEALVAARPHLVKRMSSPEIDAGAAQIGGDPQPLSPQMVAIVRKKFRL